jgi:hypothetical protein
MALIWIVVFYESSIGWMRWFERAGDGSWERRGKEGVNLFVMIVDEREVFIIRSQLEIDGLLSQ